VRYTTYRTYTDISRRRTRAICTACFVVWRHRRAADTSTNRRQGFLCHRTASAEHAADRTEAAAVDQHFRRQLKTFHSVESYTVFICQQSYLLLFGTPSPTHSFIPCLKPSFTANPSHCSPSFLLLKYSLHGLPRLFTVITEHICFLLSVFLVFLHFLVVSSVR